MSRRRSAEIGNDRGRKQRTATATPMPREARRKKLQKPRQIGEKWMKMRTPWETMMPTKKRSRVSGKEAMSKTLPEERVGKTPGEGARAGEDAEGAGTAGKRRRHAATARGCAPGETRGLGIDQRTPMTGLAARRGTYDMKGRVLVTKGLMCRAMDLLESMIVS